MAYITRNHYGDYDASTRKIPALKFLEIYTNKVDSIDITGDFSKWYAPSAKFYNADSVVYHGGKEIWAWMGNLFGPFFSVHHRNQIVRSFKASPEEAAAERDAWWVILETETTFNLKPPIDTDGPVIIRRFLMFLIGASEVEGQGTEGLQILEAKAWWDSGILQREVAKRKQQLASKTEISVD